MNVEQLWIGDKVLIKPKKVIGVFEGISKTGLAKVNVSGEIMEINGSDLDFVEEEEIKNPAMINLIEELEPTPKELKATGNAIDLHIDKLAPHLADANPTRIFDYQIESCSNFIESSIKRKQGVIHIIHGKGKGILKAAVLELLKSHKQIKFFVESNQGGALDVWLE